MKRWVNICLIIYGIISISFIILLVSIGTYNHYIVYLNLSDYGKPCQDSEDCKGYCEDASLNDSFELKNWTIMDPRYEDIKDIEWDGKWDEIKNYFWILCENCTGTCSLRRPEGTSGRPYWEYNHSYIKYHTTPFIN